MLRRKTPTGSSAERKQADSGWKTSAENGFRRAATTDAVRSTTLARRTCDRERGGGDGACSQLVPAACFEIGCGVGFGLFARRALRRRRYASGTEGGRSAGRWEMTHTDPSLFVRGVLSWWSVSLAYPRAGRARDLLDGRVNINNSALVSQPKSTLAAMPWPRMITGLVLAFAGRTPAKPQPQGRPRFVAVRPRGALCLYYVSISTFVTLFFSFVKVGSTVPPCGESHSRTPLAPPRSLSSR